MRKNPFALDMLLTEEEILYVRKQVVTTFQEQLVARKIFPIENMERDAKFYRFYDEAEPGQAVIDMDGKAQSDDFPDLHDNTIPIPVIHKEALLNWRDMNISSNGTKLLDRTISAITRMVAEAEDRLLISGECTTWPALGVEGLFTATGRATVAASGVWPTNALDDINLGRSHLQGHGFVGVEPILLGPPAMIKCLDNFMANTAITYRQALLDNGLISGTMESVNAYAADCGQDSVVLVIPGAGNFWAAQSVPLTTVPWPDKTGNLHITVREAITPVVARPTSIYEISTITCNLP